MKFEYSKNKYSLENVIDTLIRPFDNIQWFINDHKDDDWQYEERSYIIMHIENGIAECYDAYNTIDRRDIPLKDLSLTEEYAIQYELDLLFNKLSKEDKEFAYSLLEQKSNLEELSFVAY